MKMFMALFVLTISLAHAHEVTIVDTIVHRASFDDMLTARFQMNTTTGEGNVSVTLTEYQPAYPGPWGCDPYGRCYPRHRPAPMPITLFQQTVRVDGLVLHGDRVVFAAPEGDVECGKLGVSRVFKRPTIYLSGKCELISQINGNRITVKLKTK